ncbi:hypothetical protein XabCFBP2524_02675 [Xanthomonas axonopodis pv. begoniae]|nr:hypothetical protein XabCFBP2524_02675 [Xanthomonas axonopodis pv. begoniae]
MHRVDGDRPCANAAGCFDARSLAHRDDVCCRSGAHRHVRLCGDARFASHPSAAAHRALTTDRNPATTAPRNGIDASAAPARCTSIHDNWSRTCAAPRHRAFAPSVALLSPCWPCAEDRPWPAGRSAFPVPAVLRR